MNAADYAVFVLYFLIVSVYGWAIYKRKQSAQTDTKDFFLAEGSLTWWAIGASLIASNISAEQFIGMSGAGFTMGLAVASYEWMAAATLIIVAVFFMPVYLKNKIYTMPQFLHTRYNGTVAIIMAVFWILLYVVVNLTSILFLGALAISALSGLSLYVCMVGLALFAAIITLGGMKVIGYTDVIQVFFLVAGGMVTTYLALDLVAQQFGEQGVRKGFGLLLQHAPEKFHMILRRDNPYYLDMPGLTALLGGMWVANFSYWGCNQYITQRALGAQLPVARNGILFAAFLKLLMPVIVILPGIAVFALAQHNQQYSERLMHEGKLLADKAYPILLDLLPHGLRGLSFAALTAAIVASLAGKTNSIATIFTLDIYQKLFKQHAEEKHLVHVGRVAIVLSLLIAVFIAPFLGIDKGGLNYIQEYTGFVSPGIFAMFLLGLFWKRTTSSAAIFAIVGGFGLSVLLKFLPLLVDLKPLASWGFAKETIWSGSKMVYAIPFLDRMGIVFVLAVAGMIVISLWHRERHEKNIEVDISLFKVHPAFLAGSLLITGVLVALYLAFW